MPASRDLFNGIARNFQVFDPLDFIPEPNKHLGRYCGWHSNKARGLRARAASSGAAETDPHQTPTAGRARRRWAALLKRIWQVDLLQCPCGGGAMKIVSFIDPGQRDVIDKILDHGGLFVMGGASLRRNLQAEQLQRLIDLSMTDSGFGAAARPIATLSTHKLRVLNKKIENVLEESEGRIDAYSAANLSEARVRIEQALEAQYIRNLDDINVRLQMPVMFGEPAEGN